MVGVTTDAELTGGGEQESATAPLPSHRPNTSVLKEEEIMNNRPTPDRVDGRELTQEAPQRVAELHHGDVLIAAITSCTNTSNPSVMLAAGLMAKKASARGLKPP